jgi:uncharacterized membrane protein YfcA
VVLGLIGSGGSILTIPVLVYLLAVEPVLATAYSLFVVGVVSGTGAIKYIQKGLVEFKTVFVFAVPAVVSVYFMRRFGLPAIPENLFWLGDFLVTKNIFVMVVFAVLMLFSSVSMIKKPKSTDMAEPSLNYGLLVLLAILTGLLTGLVGAGGGFIIIPILVIFAKLPMKKAVASSLMIITINSLIGFTGDIENFDIDWGFLLPFSILPVLGIFLGIWLQRFIDGHKLKKSFGWFVLFMGIYIIFRESA